jgi:hypothetical protein
LERIGPVEQARAGSEQRSRLLRTDGRRSPVRPAGC